MIVSVVVYERAGVCLFSDNPVYSKWQSAGLAGESVLAAGALQLGPECDNPRLRCHLGAGSFGERTSGCVEKKSCRSAIMSVTLA